MTNFQYEEEPVIVSRDAGYSKIKLLSPENMKKSWERINNPDIVTGRYKLKELLEEVGIVVNPEAMTFWYKHTK
ncbi:hypothetical protein [Methanobrevibacter sp. UBA212]|jgi:hypothetical protein|uniref:hypothetical protein n=1 Tax=Methanobrevibacter sp. UBA212 TaxID=1915476 RepID=UPI0025E40AD1|nr:hypothetical protein [Methanobrevibacter sp. UBA212]